MISCEFTLLYQVPLIDDLDSYIEPLVVAGCSDGLIGISDEGLLEIDFERTSASADIALSTAMRSIEAAIPDAYFIEATPDYVGLTDVASHLKVSRQYVRKVWEGSRSQGFPEPVRYGKSPIWNLATILNWMVNQDSSKANKLEPLFNTSIAAMLVNFNRAQENVRAIAPYSGGGNYLALSEQKESEPKTNSTKDRQMFFPVADISDFRLAPVFTEATILPPDVDGSLVQGGGIGSFVGSENTVPVSLGLH